MTGGHTDIEPRGSGMCDSPVFALSVLLGQPGALSLYALHAEHGWFIWAVSKYHTANCHCVPSVHCCVWGMMLEGHLRDN